MTTAQTLVSVLMPSLNQAAFIESAIRSVLDQDYPNVELVVADGGSTDGTLRRLETLLDVYGTRLRWVSEGDKGPANAVNKALGMARGRLIGWLNSDDLYAPGAVSAAAQHFADNAGTLLVYGEGEHIDGTGRPLGRYPTRLPSVGIEAFHEGCFICQPTVFLRREVFDELGPLDESLSTAFDFELWLRIFRRFPGQIAHIDRVQAFSRLHEACITQRMRRLVAIEGIRVLAQHLGNAKPHWLLTYFEELYAHYPFDGDVLDLKTHAAEVLDQVKGCLEDEALQDLQNRVFEDARLKTALPGVFATLHPDGWASSRLVLRYRASCQAHRSIKLHCVHAMPRFSPLRLQIKTSWGRDSRIVVERPGPFSLLLDCPIPPAGNNLVILIESKDIFVPQALDPNSTDSRELAFRVEGLQLID